MKLLQRLINTLISESSRRPLWALSITFIVILTFVTQVRGLPFWRAVYTGATWAAVLLPVFWFSGRRLWLPFLSLCAAGAGVYYNWVLTPSKDPWTQFSLAVVVAGVNLPAAYGLPAAFFAIFLASLVSLHSGKNIPEMMPSVLGLAGFYLGFSLLRLRREARIREQRYLREIEAAHRRLQDAHAELQAAAERAVTMAAVEERNRIAREMHDILGHTLTVLVVQLQAVKRLLPGQVSRAVRQLDALEELSRQSLQEVRQVVRAMTGKEAGEAGVAALRALVSEFAEKTGLAGRFSVHGSGAKLDASISPQLFRILQESLTNARRHGRPSFVSVRLTVGEEKVTLTVENDGVPQKPGGTGSEEMVLKEDTDAPAGARGHFPGRKAGDPVVAVNPGFGLRGMEERCARFGGTLRYGILPGGRFRVEAVLSGKRNNSKEV